MYSNGGGGGGGGGMDPDEADFLFFSHQRRKANGGAAPGFGGAGAGAGGGAGAGSGGGGGGGFGHAPPLNSLFAQPPRPDRFVSLDRVTHKLLKNNINISVKRRYRAIAAAMALANGDEATAAAVAAAAENDDDDDEDGEAQTGPGAVPPAIINSELAAISTQDDAMYYSSCSEDENVLVNTLNILSNMSLNQNGGGGVFEDGHGFEEDTATTQQAEAPPLVPEDFDDTAHPKQKPAHAHSSDDSANDPHIREEKSSRSERISQLRVRVANEHRRAGNPAPECFRCMYGNQNYDAVNARPMHNLFTLMDSEIGRRDLRAVAKVAHEYFKHAIYEPMVRAGKRMFMWRTRDIYTHLTKHDFEPRIMIYSSLREINQLTTALINETHSENPITKQIVPNTAVIRAYIDTTKLKLQIMGLNPKKQMFYDDRAAIDFSAIAASAGGDKQSAASGIGHYNMEAFAPPNAVHVRNKQ